MMILISGQPGNGKTLRAMALLVEEYERNAEAVKAGKESPRNFFANIRGVAFDWVKPIPRDDLGRPDYRLCPDGSFVVFDEAHSDGKTEELQEYGLLFPSTGRPGESDDDRIRAMSTHRHRGFDLVFVTQWPSKIHHQVRTLVGKHIHMNRSMGLNVAGTFTWARVQSDPYDEKEREKADEEMWRFPKELFDKYKSATLHTATYKFKIPPKVWSALSVAVVVCLIAWAAYAYSTPEKKEHQSGGGAQAEAPTAPARAAASEKVDFSTAIGVRDALKPAVPTMPWTAPAFARREVVAEPRVFCASSPGGLDANGESKPASCTCLTEQATEYRMPERDCRDIARRGEAYNPFRRVDLDEVRGAGAEAPAVESEAAPALEAASGTGSASELQASYGGFRPGVGSSP